MKFCCFFFFQAEDGIRDLTVTGVQTCALPICPFAGAPRARLFPGALAREIEPGSAFLAHLRAARSDVPHLSIAGGGDRVVPEGALLGEGERLLVERAGHNEVLYHPETVAAVVARIRAAGRSA